MEAQEKKLIKRESLDLISGMINKAKESCHDSAGPATMTCIPLILMGKEYRIYKKEQALANV